VFDTIRMAKEVQLHISTSMLEQVQFAQARLPKNAQLTTEVCCSMSQWRGRERPSSESPVARFTPNPGLSD
jgi:hypothetical protein